MIFQVSDFSTYDSITPHATRDRDSIPAAAHGTIRRRVSLGQTELGDLFGSRGDGGLLEDRADTLARVHGVVQHFVVSLVTGLTGQVEELPLRRVDVGVDPI